MSRLSDSEPIEPTTSVAVLKVTEVPEGSEAEGATAFAAVAKPGDKGLGISILGQSKSCKEEVMFKA